MKFPTIDMLLDFQTVTQTQAFEVNTEALTLTGSFSDAQLELAQNGYQVIIVDQFPIKSVSGL